MKIRFIILALTQFFVHEAKASVITHQSILSLKNEAASLIVEDWRAYDLFTVLSNQTVNGIIYPGDNSLGEPLVTLGEFCSLRCISYLTDEGRTRSFGRRSVSFGFTSKINAFSLSLTQFINDQLDGSSIWQIEFDTGFSAALIADYTVADSFKSAYVGFSGLEGAASVTISQIRNDANVVWSFADIGYQSTSVSAPSSIGIIVMLLGVGLYNRRVSKMSELSNEN